jgi:hypothetical protein
MRRRPGARLIDFEIMHERSLPATTRHADDLLVFLLDKVDRVPSTQWLPFTTCFVKAYAERDVIAELQKRLVIPRGLALLWWNVRTNFAKTGKVAAIKSAAQRDQQTSTLPTFSRGARPPEATCFENLPGDQSGNAEREFAYSCD